MAKEGLDYISLDVRPDNKLKLIEAEFGLKGFAIIVKLFLRIGEERGYYCEFDDEVALLFSDECKESRDVVSEIVRAAIRRGIFDKRLYEEYNILTSHGLQRRYLASTKRRTCVELKNEYLLLDVHEITGNVYINGKNVYRNQKNVYRNSQSKVEYSKVEYSKGEREGDKPPAHTQKKYGEYKNVILSDDELEKLKDEFQTDWSRRIERLSAYLEGSGKSYKNHYAVIREWAKQDKEKDRGENTESEPPYYKSAAEIMGNDVPEWVKKGYNDSVPEWVKN